MTPFQKGVISFPQYAAGASLLFNSKKVSLLSGKEKKKKNVCQEITEYISEIINTGDRGDTFSKGVTSVTYGPINRK
jgi:hypothetical protein